MKARHWRWVLRKAKWLPPLLIVQQFGCLPEGAFSQVLAENIVLTSAVAIQSITSLVFNSLFGFI